MLLDRRKVYTTLVANGIPVPHHIIVSRDDSGAYTLSGVSGCNLLDAVGTWIQKPALVY